MIAAFCVMFGAIILGALLNCAVPPRPEVWANRRVYREETTHASLPSWVRNGLALIRSANAMDIVDSIVSVQPMTSRVGRIAYLDVIRERAGRERTVEEDIIEGASRELSAEVFKRVVASIPYGRMNIVVGPHRYPRGGSWCIVRREDGRREVLESVCSL
jgi:hypothetical protein